MEDKKISEAVELLYRGAKMLSQHCPDCKVPLFKDKDKIFCPSCKREVVFEKDEPKSVEKAKEVKDSRHFEPFNGNLEEIFKDALINLATKLKNYESLEELRETIELTNKLVDLIEKLKRLGYI